MRASVVLAIALSGACTRDASVADAPATSVAAYETFGAPTVAPAALPAHGKPVELCVSSQQACARLADGRVACWGEPLDGFTPYDRPVLVGVDHATQIDCPTGCATLADGGVRCWSRWNHADDHRTHARPEDEHDVAEVRGAADRGCVRTRRGAVRCWRANDPESTIVPGVTGATALEYAWPRACAKVAGGKVTCWDLQTLGDQGMPPAPSLTREAELPPAEAFALGFRARCRYVATGSFECGTDPGKVAVIGEVPDAVDVHGSCALDAKGGVACWKGRTRVDVGIKDAVALGGDGATGCALRRTGEAECWGDDARALLGRGDVVEAAPVAVIGIADAVDVATSLRSTCAVRATGAVACWGRIAGGGIRTVPGVADAVAVSVSESHACVLTRSAGVRCFASPGSDNTGGRGENAAKGSAEAREVVLPKRATLVRAGTGFTCALMEDETVMCWGNNGSGELGDGTHEARERPMPVAGIGRVKTLAVDGHRVCTVDASGLARCWGDASYRSRLMAEGSCPTPVRVPALDHAARFAMSVAITRAGDVTPFDLEGAAPDRGEEPARADAGPGYAVLWTRPTTLHGVVEASGNGRYLCGRTAGSDVRCAGDGSLGQLGDGTRAGRVEEKGVAGVEKAEEVVVAGAHACARAGGRVLCWGDNSDGAVAGMAAWAAPAPVSF